MVKNKIKAPEPPKRNQKSLGKQIENVPRQKPFQQRKQKTGGFKDFMKFTKV